MLVHRLNISLPVRKEMTRALEAARRAGNFQMVNRILVIFALCEGVFPEQVASMFGVSLETIEKWEKLFLVYGLKGLRSKKSSGRPPKLTKSQKHQLASIIEAGPAAAGLSGNCWRSPMIQYLIKEKFGVFYSIHYLSQLLKNLGLSYQKAKFEAAHLDEATRTQWVGRTLPEIRQVAKQKQALLLFGDEASFPQWGTLSYTWARRGQQPVVHTSGKRKAYKVFGLIDYFTGRFFHYGTQDKLTSATYADFLTQVLAQTNQHIVLVQDGARYHTSAAMRQFFATHADRLTVYQLPAYSPDYNPIEKLWKKLKEHHTHLRFFPSFEALTTKVDQALLAFANAPMEILSLFGISQPMAIPA